MKYIPFGPIRLSNHDQQQLSRFSRLKLFVYMTDRSRMVNSISSVHPTQASEALTPAATKPQPQQSSPLPADTVSLKSLGDVDHDGDSH